MSEEQVEPLEILWNALLSRDTRQIRDAYRELGTKEQQAVLAHLRRMANEPGWHPEQRTSAERALEALES